MPCNFTAWDIGECSCVPDDEEDEPCGTTGCSACGGVILSTEGTFTDDNGTGAISLDMTRANLNAGRAANPGGTDIPVWRDPGLAAPSLPLHWASGMLSTGGPVLPVGQFCPGTEGTVNYAWGISCRGDGDIDIYLACDVRVCCAGGEGPFLFRKSTNMQPVVVAFPIRYKTVTPTCEGGFLTATASGWEIPDTCDGLTLDPPADSVTISIPYAASAPVVCCKPCGIPKEDLLATVGGVETTLVWDPLDSIWTDGTYVLSCGEGGWATFAGDGTWTLVNGMSNCDPFHLEFSGTSDVFIDLP